MGVLRIMNRHGDTAVKWDPTDAKSVRKAKAEFDKVIRDGYLTYTTDTASEGVRGESIREFDPEAKTIIASVPLVGG